MSAEEEVGFLDMLRQARPLHRIAAGLFVLGKMSSIATGGLIISGSPWAGWCLGLTASLIGACIAICTFEVVRESTGVDSRIERLERELEELRLRKAAGG